MGLGESGHSDTPILEYQLFQHQTFPLLAQMYALQFYHNYVKRRYATRTDADAMEVVILCSSIKPLSAWFCDRAVTTCREKVGGVGFLAANGYGEMFAHAGITAEGDARVLCAKVTKELLELVMQKKFPIKTSCQPVDSTNIDISNLDAAMIGVHKFLDIFAVRLGRKVMDLAKKLQVAVSSNEGKWAGLSQRQRFYRAQMETFSPEIQAVAAAYGEWEALRSFTTVLDTRGTHSDLVHESPDKTKPAQHALSPAAMNGLCRLCMLYAVECLQKDAIWLVANKLMTIQAADNLQSLFGDLCTALRPDVMRLVNGLGIPDSINWRPMAKDWKEWNKTHNFGEVVEWK